MSIVPTYLKIKPTFENKVLEIEGSVAVYEKVALNVVDIVSAGASIEGLVVRFTSTCGHMEYARFPQGDEEWVVSGDDLTGVLDLNTVSLRRMFSHTPMAQTLGALVLLEDKNADNIYGVSGISIRNWVQNPTNPVAGSTQIQDQIDTLSQRLENHQHDDGVEGERSFPHNNLSGRDEVGAHPALEQRIDSAENATQLAHNAATTANANAITALETALEAAGDVDGIIEQIRDGMSFTPVTGSSTLGEVKNLLNQVANLLNTWRNP